MKSSSTHLSTYPSIYLSAYSFIQLLDWPSIHPSIHPTHPDPSIHSSIHPSTDLSTYPLLHPSVCPSVQLPTYASRHLSTAPSFFCVRPHVCLPGLPVALSQGSAPLLCTLLPLIWPSVLKLPYPWHNWIFSGLGSAPPLRGVSPLAICPASFPEYTFLWI